MEHEKLIKISLKLPSHLQCIEINEARRDSQLHNVTTYIFIVYDIYLIKLYP